jgi:hypothetical protein
MAIESWMNPDEAGELAAHASAMIDAALVGTDLSRDAYWAAVRKGYNTPYNDPPRRKVAAPVPVVSIGEDMVTVCDESDAPPVVAPAIAAAELRAV